MLIVTSAFWAFLVFSSLHVRRKRRRVTAVHLIWSAPLSAASLALACVHDLGNLQLLDRLIVMPLVGIVGLLAIIVDPIYYNDLLCGFVEGRPPAEPGDHAPKLGPKAALALKVVGLTTRLSMALTIGLLLLMAHSMLTFKYNGL